MSLCCELRTLIHVFIPDTVTYLTICMYFLFIYFFLKEFMEKKPCLLDMESDIQHYDCFEQMIDEIEPLIVLESIELSTGNVATMCAR